MIYQHYQERIKDSSQEVQRLNRLINQNSLGRLLVILGGGAALFYSFQTNSILLVLGITFFIVLLFAFLINRQSQLEAKRDAKLAFLQVNENEIMLQERRETVYSVGESFDDERHPYVSDLDIFGEKSLFALVNRCATSLGIQTLANWLKEGVSKKEIEERQEAVTEIANDLGWGQQFQSTMIFNLSEKIDAKSFLSRYLQDSSLTFGNKLMRLYVPIAPIVLLLAVAFSVFISPIWNIVVGIGVLHLCWTIALAGKVGVFSNKIDRVGRILARYAEGLLLIEQQNFKSVKNKALQEQLSIADKSLSKVVKELANLIDKLDTRNNILVGALLNILMLWDFRYVTKLVRWKNSYADKVLLAFDVIAELEALNSLATLKRNHPQWVMPVILNDPLTDKIIAKGIGHPLLAETKSVVNDYTNDQHLIALITGSNMAGKSTFLRTFGINAVLAYAGAVVCADDFKLPIYHLITYMRIKDSLNESTSTFKAELDRMKFILDTVSKDQHSYFLIDEMLRGTNSVDKYLGSRAIIRKLVSNEGKGMLATHDLQLASLEKENPGKVQNYHFDIQVIEGEMLFDYKLKNGECTVFNASMLLKGIGIDVDQV
ncbi:DNA mismatch repair protein MutS [Sphingobacterium sp. UT-1RO-CII-1]|uniref:MutS-related protein n=1 Tax=Sphingobacterium sp. UT-1RO-CII-1 TaxID=2995225 RepID=UPI00227D1FCB|nr:DNA mismatch repair protein MutS [Sphingobacterium sp. UT-1RO-CII-1]MCY4778027.1 DNA mismatch repair protein MutS [Sphingobacterium sp. UT-1RO-CII-1]